jgi:hypothetical protein
VKDALVPDGDGDFIEALAADLFPVTEADTEQRVARFLHTIFL